MRSGFAPPAAADSPDHCIPYAFGLGVRTMKSSWLLRIPNSADPSADLAAAIGGGAIRWRDPAATTRVIK